MQSYPEPSPRAARVIAEARTWLGTPFHHQACLRGQGVDCGQLVVGVGVALGVMPQPGPEWRMYGRTPNPRQMRRQLETFLQPVENGMQVYGDIMWIGWRPHLPMHLGFWTDWCGSGIIHAYSNVGAVVETVMPPDLLKEVHSWWRYKD